MPCIPCMQKEIPQHFYQDIFYDNRGTFYPLLLENKEAKVLDKKWIQSNISINPYKYTFRGLHYQKAPFEQAKYIQVVQGAIVDFMVDIRENHPEYGRVHYFAIEAGNAVYCPRGFAHGFITLDKDTIVQYLVDNAYSKEHEGCIKWECVPLIEEITSKVDPRFSTDRIIISEKDDKGEYWEFK